MLALEVHNGELFCAAGIYGVLVVDVGSGRVTRTLRSYYGKDLDPRFVKVSSGPLAMSLNDYANACIDASKVALFWRGCGDEQLLVMGRAPYDLGGKTSLYRIDLLDGHDRGNPAEVSGFGLICAKLPGQFPKAYVAAVGEIRVVDLAPAKVESRSAAKAFDVTFEDEVLHIACHGYGSGDCVEAFDAETGRLIAGSEEQVIEGGIVSWRGEVFGAKGDNIAVMDARTLRVKRILEVEGYHNGSMAIDDDGLCVQMGHFGGTSEPSFESGGEIGLVDPQGGRLLHRFAVDLPTAQ